MRGRVVAAAGAVHTSHSPVTFACRGVQLVCSCSTLVLIRWGGDYCVVCSSIGALLCIRMCMCTSPFFGGCNKLQQACAYGWPLLYTCLCLLPLRLRAPPSAATRGAV